jgi:hypothetical protein
MREVVGDEVLIKASGGIHSKEFAYELIKAGADRIGSALIDGRVGGQAVEVLVAVDVPQPHPFAPGQDEVERLVVVRSQALLTAMKSIDDVILLLCLRQG